jgi:putative RecB family exonuclease
MTAARPDGLYVSVSQLKTYLRCPRQYELRYVRGERPESVAVALVLGSAVHAALASYYTALRGGAVVALQDVLEVYEGAWIGAQPADLPVLTDDGAPLAAVAAQGAAMLRTFHTHAARAPAVRPVLIEAPFNVELRDPITGEVLDEKLTGVIDLVAEREGRLRIFEHKTSARRYGRDQLDFDLQPTAYLYAARELGVEVEGVTFQVLTKAATPVVQVEDVERDAAAEHEFLLTVVGVLRAIDAGAFWPVRGWACRGCAFARTCATRRP